MDDTQVMLACEHLPGFSRIKDLMTKLAEVRLSLYVHLDVYVFGGASFLSRRSSRCLRYARYFKTRDSGLNLCDLNGKMFSEKFLQSLRYFLAFGGIHVRKIRACRTHGSAGHSLAAGHDHQDGQRRLR